MVNLIKNERGFFGGIIFQIFILVALVSAGAMVVRYFTNKTLVKELGRCHSKYEGKIKNLEKKEKKFEDKEKKLEQKVSKCKKSRKKNAIGRENEVLRNGFSKCIAELKEERRPWWNLWGGEEKVDVEKEIESLPPALEKEDKKEWKRRRKRRRR